MISNSYFSQCPSTYPLSLYEDGFWILFISLTNRMSRLWISHESSFMTHFHSKQAYLCIDSRNQGQIKGPWISHSVLGLCKPVLMHLISKRTDNIISFIWFKTNIFLTTFITLHLCNTPSWRRMLKALAWELKCFV